jgi:hypothetical protein
MNKILPVARSARLECASLAFSYYIKIFGLCPPSLFSQVPNLFKFQQGSLCPSSIQSHGVKTNPQSVAFVTLHISGIA